MLGFGRMSPFDFGSHNPNDLRDLGLYVTAHHDYSINGLRMTFWLVTWTRAGAPALAFKGEAGSDAEALDIIREQVKEHL